MKAYHLKYRLSMSHSADNKEEHRHTHVLEIEIFVKPHDKDRIFSDFRSIEIHMNEVLDGFQGKYLNDIEIFGADASLEHTGETIYRLLSDEVERNKWHFCCLEISETPLRVYIIRDEDFNTRCI